MKAKCPFCDVGCARCENGFFESDLGDGVIFVDQCTEPACGFINGIHVANSDSPLPSETEPCSVCQGLTEWDIFGWSAPEPPQPSWGEGLDEDDDRPNPWVT